MLRNLVDKVAICDLCDDLGLDPTVFSRWQNQFFENGVRAFKGTEDHRSAPLEKKVIEPEAKLSRKNEVLSEVMEEHVALKKSWGDLSGVSVPHDTRDAIVDFAEEKFQARFRARRV